MVKRSFENSSEPKQRIRNMICECAVHSDINPSLILTLPGREMLCAKIFKERFPEATIVGLEREKEDFDIICQSNLVVPHNMTIEEYSRWQHKQKHHDILFLDYLGWITTPTLNEIGVLVRNDNLLHKNRESILAVTFMKSPRHGIDQALSALEEYGFHEDDDVKNEIHQVAVAVSSSCYRSDIGVAIMEAFEYKNPGGTPMYFTLFKISK